MGGGNSGASTISNIRFCLSLMKVFREWEAMGSLWVTSFSLPTWFIFIFQLCIWWMPIMEIFFYKIVSPSQKSTKKSWACILTYIYCNTHTQGSNKAPHIEMVVKWNKVFPKCLEKLVSLINIDVSECPHTTHSYINKNTISIAGFLFAGGS